MPGTTSPSRGSSRGSSRGLPPELATLSRAQVSDFAGHVVERAINLGDYERKHKAWGINFRAVEDSFRSAVETVDHLRQVRSRTTCSIAVCVHASMPCTLCEQLASSCLHSQPQARTPGIWVLRSSRVP